MDNNSANPFSASYHRSSHADWESPANDSGDLTSSNLWFQQNEQVPGNWSSTHGQYIPNHTSSDPSNSSRSQPHDAELGPSLGWAPPHFPQWEAPGENLADNPLEVWFHEDLPIFGCWTQPDVPLLWMQMSVERPNAMIFGQERAPSNARISWGHTPFSNSIDWGKFNHDLPENASPDIWSVEDSPIWVTPASQHLQEDADDTWSSGAQLLQHLQASFSYLSTYSNYIDR
uniref:Uncharacterized protein n=1 Tax=Moniliophthora roreri TaxID=221103 RepID=A0A0W0FQE6_MONRR